MKIHLYYPELKLWLTLWPEKPSGFDALTANQKGMLKQDIFLAVTGFLGKTDFPAVESGDIEEAEPPRMPDGDDGFVGQ